MSTLLSVLVQVSLRGRLKVPKQPQTCLGVKGDLAVHPCSPQPLRLPFLELRGLVQRWRGT